MKNGNRKLIFRMIGIYIISVLVSFLIGFFITSEVNTARTVFESQFTYVSDSPKDLSSMINEEFLSSVIDNHPGLDLDDINVKKMLKNNDFTLVNDEGNHYVLTTKTKYYTVSFISSSQKVINRAQTFVKYALIDYTGDKTSIVYDNDSIGSSYGSYSPWLGGIYAGCAGLIVSGIAVAFFPKKETEENNIVDNKEIFATPFHKEYWKKALTSLKDVRSIVTLAMLFGLLLISKLIHLPSGFGDLGLGLGFLFLGVIGMIYGPVVGLVVGMFSDILGYFIGDSSGAFNFLYTIQSMLAVFTYGICFYRTKITFSKVLLSRMVVNLILNVLYGSLLMVMMYFEAGKFESSSFGYAFKIYALYYSLPKNLVYLIPQSIVLFALIKVLSPILGKMHYIPKEMSENIKVF